VRFPDQDIGLPTPCAANLVPTDPKSVQPSAEHVLYLLAQLKDRAQPRPPMVETALMLTEEPKADVDRYDRLRTGPAIKAVMLASPVLACLMMNGGVHVR
jgi:hypothetical protein